MPVRFLLTIIRILALLMVVPGFRAWGATAAWRMVSAPVAENGDELPLCEKAPAESVFFEPGDELRDLSAWMQARYAAALSRPEDEGGTKSLHEAFPALEKWQGDWIVWNARSHCIVAGGCWNDLYVVGNLSGFDRQPLQVRTTFRLRTAEGEKRVSGITNKNQAGWIGEGSLSCRYETSAGWEDAVLSLDHFTWQTSEPEISWNVGGAEVHLNNGEEECLMRRRTSADGEDALFVLLRIEEEDGTPFSECRWKEESGKRIAWRWLPLESSLADGTCLRMSGHRDEGILARCGGGDGLTGFPVIQAPPELREWVRGPLIDLSSGAMARAFSGMKSVSYDPVSTRLILVGNATDAKRLDEDSHGISDPAGPFIWAEASAGDNSWGMAARANGRAVIDSVKNEEIRPAFHLDLDGQQEEMAARCLIRFPVDQSLKSEPVCRSGEPLEIGHVTGADGRPVAVKLMLQWSRLEPRFD